jgi:superfamily II DNA or RNA helicase
MGNLQSLNLDTVYDSSEYHLVHDLMVPLLRQSRLYCRGVGYFSSGWLRLASEGIEKLIASGGYARLIMSPILDQKDWEAIVLGQSARDNHALKNCLQSSMTEISLSLESNTLNTFAWLIADKLLDIKFAVPRAGFRTGDYHDKVGYFVDHFENTVAIHGSYNDSVKGTLNGEAFSVFRSWDPGQVSFVERHISRLNQLWQDKNSQFHTFELPDAVREQIVQLRSSENRPYAAPQISSLDVESSPHPCVPEHVSLRDYQEEAIESWQQNGRHGILEMATGAGKTFTALSASVRELRERGKLAVLIIVPQLHLLDQWREDCIEFGYSPILCGSSHNNWRIKLRSAITDFKLSASDLCIIAVHKTASDHPFIDAVSKIPSEQIMLIADEVHGLGSGVLKNALRDEYEMRLGLSATPSRWYDESGTAVLLNYFNSICFQFTLRDAIPEYLVEYRYEPNLVYLTALEENRIGELSALIGRLSSKKGAAGLDELEQRMLEKALRDRASVVKKAENKLLVLRDRLRSLRASGETFKHSLFYSPESQHLDVLRVLRDDGIPAHQFIGEDVPKEVGSAKDS